jgi:hypothetical protein
MRELRWSLGKMRGISLFVLGLLSIVLILTNTVTDGRNLFGMGYRAVFAILQIVMYVMLWERFSVIFRKSQFHRFYRSMPGAWEKEKNRIVWIDGFFFACSAAVFAVGAVFRDIFAEGTVPTMLVLIFFAHSIMAKVFAILPFWGWWILEIVFFWITLLLPMEYIPVGVGIGAVGVYFIMQSLLNRMLKSYWYTEE